MSRKIQFWILAASILAGCGLQRADAVERNLLRASLSDGGRALPAKPVEIRNGFVIFEGQYIPPPYVVRSQAGSVYINGLEIPQVRSSPFARRQIGAQRSNLWRAGQAARIKRGLDQCGMLICVGASEAGLVPAHEALSILDALITDEPGDAKLKRLLRTGPSWITSAQWAELIETFDAPAELCERVLALQHAPEPVEEEADTWWNPSLFVSGMTIGGFALAVVALGMLLSCRPPMIKGWRQKDSSRASRRQVIFLVALIVILNIYDLICTIFANGAGGLWEINPFAGELIQHGPSIVAFKLTLTIGAAVLFVVTRCHRLAQIGSYWFGVLYTVLILRWITFNSILL